MIKQILPSKFCLECQGCCRFNSSESIWSPRILKEEIKDFLKNNLPPALLSQDSLKIRLIPFREQNNFLCPFLILENNKCKIYDFRPFECQLYPFLFNRKDNRVYLAVDLKCPFIKENLEKQNFKEYTQYLIQLFDRPQWLNALKNSPQIIQEYEQVLDLEELKI